MPATAALKDLANALLERLGFSTYRHQDLIATDTDFPLDAHSQFGEQWSSMLQTQNQGKLSMLSS